MHGIFFFHVGHTPAKLETPWLDLKLPSKNEEGWGPVSKLGQGGGGGAKCNPDCGASKGEFHGSNTLLASKWRIQKCNTTG